MNLCNDEYYKKFIKKLLIVMEEVEPEVFKNNYVLTQKLYAGNSETIVTVRPMLDNAIAMIYNIDGELLRENPLQILEARFNLQLRLIDLRNEFEELIEKQKTLKKSM